MNRSHVMVALVAGLVGLVAGRLLPRPAPGLALLGSARRSAPVMAPADCKADRAQLASMRTQLAICMAYRDPSEPAPGSSASREPSASPDPPREGMAWVAAEARRLHERDALYPEAVYVRRKDGADDIYRPNEHSPDSDDVYARKFLDGTILYYLGPDAGARSDPDAWGSLRDLAGPDGLMIGKTRVVFLKPDAGVP